MVSSSKTFYGEPVVYTSLTTAGNSRPITTSHSSMATITARIERTPYETHLSTGTQVIVVDEPKEVGGQDRGMRPGELLAGSLASCTAVTVRMYADRKGWSLDSVVIHVDYTYDPAEKRSRFVMKLILNGDLDPEQRLRLREIADRCPIHRALEHPIDFETTLVDEPAQPVANQ